jgi:hypothetical protein
MGKIDRVGTFPYIEASLNPSSGHFAKGGEFGDSFVSE